MDFSEALKEIKKGNYVKREPWGKNDLFLSKTTISETENGVSKGAVKEIIQIKMRNTISGDTASWMAPHKDLLAEDWVTSVKTLDKDKK